MDTQLLVVQKLEEKERVLQGNLGTVEKELTLRSQALELNKRKVRRGNRSKQLRVLRNLPRWFGFCTIILHYYIRYGKSASILQTFFF